MPEIFKNLMADFAATTGWSSNQNAGGLTSDMFERSFGVEHEMFSREAAGLRSLSGLRGARQYMAPRLDESQQLYASFVDESNRYAAGMDAMHSAASFESETFMNIQTQLDASKAKLGANKSASSLGAYSVAAKRQMQETQRMANVLKGMNSPQQIEMDTTFINPLTNKREGQEAQFNPTGQDIGGKVADMIRSDYKDRQNAIISEVEKEVTAKTGFNIDSLEGGQASADLISEGLNKLVPSTHAIHADAFWEDVNSGKHDHRSFGSDWTVGQYRKFNEAKQQYSGVREFAESRALAEMSSMTEGFKASDNTGNVYTTGSQVFQGADRDSLIDQMIADTTTKYETQSLKDTASLEAEFEKRKGLALSQATDVSRRNKLNATRAEQNQQKAREYEKLLAQQQQEYASTLSSAGAVDSQSGGVTFKDIRPA